MLALNFNSCLRSSPRCGNSKVLENKNFATWEDNFGVRKLTEGIDKGGLDMFLFMLKNLYNEDPDREMIQELSLLPKQKLEALVPVAFSIGSMNDFRNTLFGIESAPAPGI